MALRRCALLGLLLLATAVLLATMASPALGQTYDYEQPQDNTNFQQTEDSQASEFPGGEDQGNENPAEGGTMGGSGQEFNQDPYPNQEQYPGADQDFGQQSDMATEPGQTDMTNVPGDNQEAFGQSNPAENTPNENVPGDNIPNENVPGDNTPNENTPGDNTQNEGADTTSTNAESAPGEPANPDATNPSETAPGETAAGETIPEASAMEDNSAGAALSPSSAAATYGAEYQDSWKKIKGGQVGPETIIGAAIGAVLGMSLCICCICVCYIRQRNIARAQYGPHGGGAIEL